MIDISNNKPTLCYREVEKATIRDDKNTYTKLIEQDKRYKEIAKEKTIEDVKKFIKETTIPFSPFQTKEQDLLYFIMLKQPNSKHISSFGLKGTYPESEEIAEILPKLTEEQKALIFRDFIVSHLTETWGVNRQSELLLDFVSLHFPDKVEELGAPHEEVFQKRHERIKERLGEIEKAANHLNKAKQTDEPVESQTLPTLALSESIESIQEETEDVPEIDNEVPVLTVGVIQVNEVELSKDDQLPQAVPDNSFVPEIGGEVPIYEGTIEPAITEPLSEVA